MSEEAQSLITSIRQTEQSLDDSGSHAKNNLTITYPLMDCLRQLRDKHQTVSRLHRERFEQVRKLVEALDSYASHLEPSFLQIKLPPTDPQAQLPPTFDLGPAYVASLDNEFTRVYEEYNKRMLLVAQTAGEIVNLWSELGTPQAQIDSTIVQHARDSPEQLGLHQDDLRRLTIRKDKLVAEKTQRERRLKELRVAVEALWDRLGVDDAERKPFLSANRGCGLRQINDYEDELSRLNELKKQNLHIFVEDARVKLQDLWDSLYFSEEEMLEFTPAFSEVYSDALLAAHEHEITRLETLKDQRAPILAAIDKHRSLIKDREDLEKSSHDASRLMAKGQKGEKRDPGKLLREEKMRKRIAKDLPKVEAELRKTLDGYEAEYGRPFCVHGEPYIDELEAALVPAPPTRSKTPNSMSQTREPPKSAGRAPASQPQSRAGTMRGPPPRSKTPTAMPRLQPAATVLTASKLGASTMGSLKLSPSKIPAASRVPMSTMRDGNNSPERRLGHKATKSQPNLGGYRPEAPQKPQESSLCAPPPKMRNLFISPTPAQSRDKENVDRNASVDFHGEPGDPYVDQSAFRAAHASAMAPPSRPQYGRALPAQDMYSASTYAASATSSRNAEYPHAPPSRALSHTSSVASSYAAGSLASGSENWEIYTDASETDEVDAREAYYARVKAQQARAVDKRQSPAPAMPMLAKRSALERNDNAYREGTVEGSDAAWTDDLGEVF